MTHPLLRGVKASEGAPRVARPDGSVYWCVKMDAKRVTAGGDDRCHGSLTMHILAAPTASAGQVGFLAGLHFARVFGQGQLWYCEVQGIERLPDAGETG